MRNDERQDVVTRQQQEKAMNFTLRSKWDAGLSATHVFLITARVTSLFNSPSCPPPPDDPVARHAPRFRV